MSEVLIVVPFWGWNQIALDTLLSIQKSVNHTEYVVVGVKNPALPWINEIEPTLAKFAELLKPNEGFLLIEVPDFEEAIVEIRNRGYTEENGMLALLPPEELIQIDVPFRFIYGGQAYPQDNHLFGYTKEYLEWLLKRHFNSVKRIPQGERHKEGACLRFECRKVIE